MNHLQVKASDPKSSAWVSASAGTGKTKILTDRVLRLLLKAVPFGKILCLTFTNAAAGEMQERVASCLKKWSELEYDALAIDIENITNLKPKADELARAKNLYNIYLKSQDPINIHTIHSFCQKILKKFPIEASVSPNFKIIDNIKAHEIIQHIKRGLYDSPEFEPISHYFAENFHDVIVDEIFNEIIDNKTKFTVNDEALEDFFEQVGKLVYELKNSVSDIRYYQAILAHPLILDLVDNNATIAQIKSFFLTKDGAKKKRIVPAKIAKQGSNLYADLEKIQHNVYLIDQQERTKHIENYSNLLTLKAIKILSDYDKYKKQKNLLDYDDLIEKTTKLLTEKSAKQWVLYKLDGGIDHLLVDEAQDTSPMQWQIIEALVQEFYSGNTARDDERTIFVVGDEKQSIFSFQGADVEAFYKMNKLIKERLTSASKEFVDINLDISYRSLSKIIDVVEHVFSKIKKQEPNLFVAKVPKIKNFRDNCLGSVQLWPLCKTEKANDMFWPFTGLDQIAHSSKQMLAEQIAEFIANKVKSGVVLARTSQRIRPSDFMILFRRRDEFTNEVIKAIKQKGLEVMGLDRINLSDSLAVRDLIAVAKFVLNPEDNLNLAALLKSPIIGTLEGMLQEIAICRREMTIWHYLMFEKERYSFILEKLLLFLELYRTLDVSNFFHFICDVMNYREILNEFCEDGSNDSIDELLYFTYNYSQNHDNSLQKFIFWFENYQISIKRDVGNIEAVKIMTVHASKGLQSPFVILCDTTSMPTNNETFYWNKSGNLVAAKNSSYIPDTFRELKSEIQHKALQEYMRLLYVGMTRAEDHLIICGYQGHTELSDHCWYKIVQSSMNDIATKDENSNILLYGLDESSDSLQSDIERHNSSESTNSENYFVQAPKVSWYLRSKNDESAHKKSPVSPYLQQKSMQYGLVFHKIMEDAVKMGNLQMMQNHPLLGTLSSPELVKIKNSISQIVKNDEFCALLQKDIRTELSIGAISDNGEAEVGRIDLVVFDSDTITIVDYKSDHNPPQNSLDIPVRYIEQLDFYASILQKLYPEYKIISRIFWLETGNFAQ